MDIHISQFTTSHTTLLLQDASRTKSELTTTRKDLEVCKGKLEETRTDLKKANDLLEKQQKINKQMLRIMEKIFHQDLSLSKMFETLQSDQQHDIEPFEIVDVNGKTFKFGNHFSALNYKERIKAILSKMEVGAIYHLNGNQAIFKLLLKEDRDLLVSFPSNVQGLQFRGKMKHRAFDGSDVKVEIQQERNYHI